MPGVKESSVRRQWLDVIEKENNQKMEKHIDRIVVCVCHFDKNDIKTAYDGKPIRRDKTVVPKYFKKSK